MTLHILPTSLAIAFDTMFLSGIELDEAINVGIARWADTYFYTDPESENEQFYENEQVFCHEDLIREIITDVRNEVRHKNVLAENIAKNAFTRNMIGMPHEPLTQSHGNYIAKLEEIIHQNTNFTGSAKQKTLYENAIIRFEENKDILSDVFVSVEDRMELEETGKKIDSEIFVKKTTDLISFAKDKNYIPYKMKRHYRNDQN
jgi:hypothetical protein